MTDAKDRNLIRDLEAESKRLQKMIGQLMDEIERLKKRVAELEGRKVVW